MAALPLVAAATGIPARQPDEPLRAEHLDLAASLQQIFETEIFKMARFLRRETGEDQLLFCGGCAQNCVAAGKLRAAGIFSRLFNSPVGGDMGSGLGAAFLLQRTRQPGTDYRPDSRGFHLGSEPGPIPAAAEPYRIAFSGELHPFVARHIAEGKVVGWVRGGMELGARALGARSILADPRQPRMQSTLNLKVKFRESFRPFAPAILAERVGEWFDCSEESDYMNYTANLLPALRTPGPASFGSLRERLDFPRCRIPSVVHVDFSARLQTVRREVHPDFHRLIADFAELTGVPILINTSFNVSGPADRPHRGRGLGLFPAHRHRPARAERPGLPQSGRKDPGRETRMAQTIRRLGLNLLRALLRPAGRRPAAGWRRSSTPRDRPRRPLSTKTMRNPDPHGHHSHA